MKVTHIERTLAFNEIETITMRAQVQDDDEIEGVAAELDDHLDKAMTRIAEQRKARRDQQAGEILVPGGEIVAP